MKRTAAIAMVISCGALLVGMAPAAPTAVAAFPGAVGFGAQATGGRGYQVSTSSATNVIIRYLRFRHTA